MKKQSNDTQHTSYGGAILISLLIALVSFQYMLIPVFWISAVAFIILVALAVMQSADESARS